MACHPEHVTGYVDGQLAPWREREVERHLSFCPVCAAQAVFELEVHESLRSLPEAVFPAGLSDRILVAALGDLRLTAH